ncbi:response regulator transcription factor [Granulosicoccus antarcticus]|uniref:Putative transcriptional regulatory protein YedW n=1 Tax=Granulosicoccus antarcticus IMCC3135 TaxID=1192854 RepID=A0A2Z2NQS0_9GAMM|nr:response regulator transcription factor [Granulosicoccus antarcticus]ASJ72341.1 putative transcriptional regulatory protein YedW [Granulosicoccus antarcticus IMCC3135]
MKLLLVEDSHRLQRSLGAGLRNSGYVLDQAYDGEQAWAFLCGSEYDIVVLDLMIPKIDGLTLLSKLRRGGIQAQVIILSARDTTEDRIKGLDAGADDYLVKPFSFDELLSRLRALSRRPISAQASLNSEIQILGVVIDMKDRTVMYDQQQIILTPSEYNIVALLAQRRGQIHTHDQLIDRLYDSSSDVTRNAIEAHVSALRRKLKAAGAPALVENRRGFGYFIAAKTAGESAANQAE